MIKILVDLQEGEVLAISNDMEYLHSKMTDVLRDADMGFDPYDILDGGWEDFDFQIYEYKLTEKDGVLPKVQ